MPNLFLTTEFWAAIVGGLFTLVGSFSSLWLQQRSQSRDKSRTALAFFRDQAAHFCNVSTHIENYFNANGEIWIEYVNDIEASYNIIVRNVENLTFIHDDSDRIALRSYFSNVYNMVRRATFWQRQVWEKVSILEKLDVGDVAAKAKIQAESVNARQQMKDCVLELKRLTLTAPLAVKTAQSGHA